MSKYKKGEFLLLRGFIYFPFLVKVEVVNDTKVIKTVLETKVRALKDEQISLLVDDHKENSIDLVLNEGIGSAISVSRVTRCKKEKK